MKISAVLGVAAAAVVLLCAVAPASATVLCKKNESPCANRYKAGEKITGALAVGANNVFENGLGNVACSKSPFSGVLSKEGGVGVSAVTQLSSFLEEGCTRGGEGEACTLSQVNIGAGEGELWSATFASENPANGNGLYGLVWNSLGAPGFSVVCGSVINCKFLDSSSTLFKVKGGSPATLVVEEPLNVEGPTCPASKPTWRGTWALSTPNPLFLALK